MPNHVTNILVISGDDEQRQAMFEAIKNDKVGIGSLDFSKVIPYPDNIYQGNLGSEERAKYGKDNWYDWNIEHWGTKWNCYGFSDQTVQDFDGSTIEFQTAWSHPAPILARLAEQYPDLRFEVMWADEDFGHNVGKKEYEGGVETFSHIPDGGSKEALEMAAEVHGVDLADEGYLYNETTGEYEYHDPEEAPMSLQMQ